MKVRKCDEMKNGMNFSMYAGFSNMVKKEGIERAAEYAASLGFSSVEVFSNCMVEGDMVFPDVTSAEKAREILNRYGLTVSCLSAYVSAWQNEESVQRALKMVEIASALGSPYFHHTLLTWIPLPEDAPGFEEGISAAILVAERIANHAGKLGITCLYEDQGHYVNGVEGFGKFFHEMKKRCENVGVCGDFGNVLFENERTEGFLKAYANDIRHVHVKDYLHKEADASPGMYWIKAKGNNWLRETMVGHGTIDIKACMSILSEVGYKGAYALELGHPEPFEKGVEQAMGCLKKSLNF